MIPFEAALDRVRAWSSLAAPMPAECVTLDEAADRVLADDAVAEDPYPGFDNSGVDGYAIGCAEDGKAGATLRLSGRVRAGDPPPTEPIAPRTAVRIFTGAPTPPGAWAVVMQENADARDDGILVVKADAHAGQNIRRAGIDIAPGDKVIQQGERLTAGHIALLATLGITNPKVRARLPVAILTTGDELVPVSERPAPGQLRDSNGPMLFALARGLGCAVSTPLHVRDSREELERAVLDAAQSHRIIIVTGGASAGDHDFAPSVAAHLGDVLFHGVAIRPGKPILFASLGDGALFALPGNPGATFVGFHLFVRECVAGLLRERYEPAWASVRLMEAHPTRERDDFLRATVHWGTTPPEARTTREQGSFALRSLAEAECLVRVRGRAEHKPGDLVRALLLGQRR